MVSNLPYLPFEKNEATLFFFAGFIFLVVPGRLQQTCVAAVTGKSKTTKCPFCLGKLSDTQLEEDNVPFAGQIGMGIHVG